MIEDCIGHEENLQKRSTFDFTNKFFEMGRVIFRKFIKIQVTYLKTKLLHETKVAYMKSVFENMVIHLENKQSTTGFIKEIGSFKIRANFVNPIFINSTLPVNPAFFKSFITGNAVNLLGTFFFFFFKF